MGGCEGVCVEWAGVRECVKSGCEGVLIVGGYEGVCVEWVGVRECV